MSDPQDDATYFIGIPRNDYGYATSKNFDVIHPNETESLDLIEQGTVIDESHSKTEETPKEQEVSTLGNISKTDSEVLAEQTAMDEELSKNELDLSLQQVKVTNEVHKKKELEIPVEEINTESVALHVTAPVNEEENQNSNLVKPSLKSENGASGSFLDCIAGSLIEEDGRVSQFPDCTEGQNSNSESSLKTSVVETNGQLSGVLQQSNAESPAKVSQSTVLEGKVDEENSSFEIDSKESVVDPDTNGSDGAAIVDQTSDEGSPANSQNPDCGEETDDQISFILQPSNAESPAKVSQSTQVLDNKVDEQNSSFEIDSKEYVTEPDTSDDSDEDASSDEASDEEGSPADSQNPDCGEEQNSSSDSDSESSVEATVEANAEASDVNVEEISVEQNLPAQPVRRTKEQVSEMISTFLNSPEYTNKLKEIDAIVKQLTAVEFLTPDLSPEDFEALKELYGEEARFEEDLYSGAKMPEWNVSKRKSKSSELDEDDEEVEVASKKYKFSKDLDSETKTEENICCLEEQFRLAYEEANEDKGPLQRDKKYNFSITGSGEYLKKRYKLCKHQIEKIDSLVVNAMSLDNYFSRFADETDYENYLDRKRKLHKGIQRGTKRSADVFNSSESQNRNSDDFQFGAPQPGTSSARTRSYNDKAECKQQLLHSKELCKGRFAGALVGALDYVKNLVLCVSFTGSLMIAMAIAKVFGVTFPVPKSQRKNLRDDLENSLQEFPDVNLEEP